MFQPDFIVQDIKPKTVWNICWDHENVVWLHQGINYQEQAWRGTNDFQQSLCLHFKSIFFQINQSQDWLHRACRSLSLSGDIYHGRGAETSPCTQQELSLSLSLSPLSAPNFKPHHWLSLSLSFPLLSWFKAINWSKAMPTLQNFS